MDNTALLRELRLLNALAIVSLGLNLKTPQDIFGVLSDLREEDHNIISDEVNKLAAKLIMKIEPLPKKD